MKISGVQSNQQTFGTKVYATKNAKHVLTKPGVRRNFKQQISELKSNGYDDILVLSYRGKDKDSGAMLVDLIRPTNGGMGYYYINPFFESRKFVEKQADGKDKYVDLRDLYAITKEEELIPIQWWGQSDYNAFISKYNEL